LFKYFPELATQELTLQDIFDIATEKFKQHIIYARIVQDQERIKNNYRIMDLSIPMIDSNEIRFLENLINEDVPELQEDLFSQLYNEDHLGGMIRNLEIWLRDNFSRFKNYNK